MGGVIVAQNLGSNQRIQERETAESGRMGQWDRKNYEGVPKPVYVADEWSAWLVVARSRYEVDTGTEIKNQKQKRVGREQNACVMQ